MKLISEEFFEDQEGKKVRRIFKGKTKDGRSRESIHLLEPSQWYLDNVLEPTRKDTEKFHKQLEEGKKISERITQLGKARSIDPERIAAEDDVLKDVASTVSTKELKQISDKLKWIGKKTFKQVKKYIEDNITDPEIRAFLIMLTEIVLSNAKLIRVLANRELPPEI